MEDEEGLRTLIEEVNGRAEHPVETAEGISASQASIRCMYPKRATEENINALLGMKRGFRLKDMRDGSIADISREEDAWRVWVCTGFVTGPMGTYDDLFMDGGSLVDGEEADCHVIIGTKHCIIEKAHLP